MAPNYKVAIIQFQPKVNSSLDSLIFCYLIIYQLI